MPRRLAPSPDAPPALAAGRRHRHPHRHGDARGAPFRGTILVSHVHWDHVQGLPFFAAGDRAGASVRAASCRPRAASPGATSSPRRCRRPAFPITPEGLIGAWTFDAVQPGRARGRGLLGAGLRGGPQGRSHLRLHACARARARSATCPTTPPSSASPTTRSRRWPGSTYLIHDAQFLEHERPRAVDYGHATVDDAIRLAERVGAGAVVLFHHGPHRTDDALDEIGAAVHGVDPDRRRGRGHWARPGLTRPRRGRPRGRAGAVG